MQIIVEGIATEYTDEGKGPVVLLLHGWQSNLHTFDGLAQVLSVNWRVVRLDLPGFGNAEMPPFAWRLDDYASFIRAFTSKLALQVECIGGHSFGGRVIIKGIATGKIEANKIVFIASAGVAEQKKLRKAIIKFITKIGAVVLLVPPLLFWRARIRAKLYEYLGSDYHTSGNLKNIYLLTIKENLSLCAQKIQNHSLLVWGEQDTATPVLEGLRLSRLIPNAHLEVIKNAGHFVHEEQPQIVADYVNKFLYD